MSHLKTRIEARCGGRAIDAGARARIEQVLDAIPIDYGGGCSAIKAFALADLVTAEHLTDFVEVGVYRGRCLLSVAAAFSALRRGKAVGIDPYTVADALQDDTHHVGVAVNEWARAFDWEGLHSEVSETIDALGLGGRCELWRTTSQQAASRFPDSSIDMVHIDGNHDRAAVEDDIDLYLPKLRPGGFVILDDVSWESIRPAYLRMLDRAELVFQFFDGRSLGVHDGVGNDFAIFRLTGP
jgi:hypothetical protein